MQNRRLTSLILASSLVLLSACNSIPSPTLTLRDTHENLNAVLWMQTSVEYRMITHATYQNARNSIKRALEDKTWTAATEQVGKKFDQLPPAIIVDIDETIFDNSPSQAQTVKDRTVYDTTETQWNNWVKLKSALAIPGAQEFLQWVNQTYPTITVFYVTNRSLKTKNETRENLKQLGFPLKEGLDVLITKEESVPPGSNKSARRSKIAESYRIILLAGDDLGDFIPSQGTPEQRLAAASQWQSFWGERWIILPNPSYGSWERALTPGNLTPDEILKAKFDRLKTYQ